MEDWAEQFLIGLVQSGKEDNFPPEAQIDAPVDNLVVVSPLLIGYSQISGIIHHSDLALRINDG